MCRLSVVCSLLFLLASCVCQEYLPGIPVNTDSKIIRINPFLKPNLLSTNEKEVPLAVNLCANKYGPMCENCYSLLTCAHETINKQTCGSIDPTKPFCVNSACSATTPKTCNVPFRCTSAGVFPSPYDCTMYYFCTDNLAQNTVAYKCPTNYVYDSMTGLCKQKKLTTDCKTISCSGLSNRYQIFAGDKSILAYCADTPNIQETILFRCKDFENMQYDPDTLECKYICKAEGRFPDRIDCKKYYECYKVGVQLQVEHMTCPTGFIYNDVRKQCIAGSQCPAIW